MLGTIFMQILIRNDIESVECWAQECKYTKNERAR